MEINQKGFALTVNKVRQFWAVFREAHWKQ